MAAALQCEICGGKLVGKTGGVFECDSCGMEYSTEWAKQKIQEIKGTVRVEGTVEVTGKLQVAGGSVTLEGAATKESLLKRAKMCIEDKEFTKAKELLEQVLNVDPECGEAYLYRYMAKKRLRTETAFKQRYTDNCNDEIACDSDVTKAFLYSIGEKRSFLLQCKEERERALPAHLDSEERLRTLQERAKKAAKQIFCSCHSIIGLRTDGTVLVTGGKLFDICNVSDWHDIVEIACACNHVVGLRADGTVAAAGENHDGQCNVSSWNNVIAIACSDSHTVGLRADGTVVASGKNEDGQCNVSNWRDIIAIACGDWHTVGFRTDGTVVAAGKKGSDWCNVSNWHDIVAIACGGFWTAGFYADGTVISTKDSLSKVLMCDMSMKWKNVTAFVSKDLEMIGLRSDGMVIGDHKAKDWTNIIAVAYDKVVSNYTIVGLCADGTVTATGYIHNYKNYRGQWDVEEWCDIVAVCCSEHFTVGLRADGTVVTTDKNMDTTNWKLFDSIDTLEEELKQAAENRELRKHREAEAREIAKRREAEARTRRKHELEAEMQILQAELANLKGIFSGKRRREIETRLAAIETEQKGL